MMRALENDPCGQSAAGIASSKELYVSRIAASLLIVSVLLTACGQEAAVPSNTAQAATSPNLVMAEQLPTVVVSAKREGDRS
jgi:hypothetical protein